MKLMISDEDAAKTICPIMSRCYPIPATQGQVLAPGQRPGQVGISNVLAASTCQGSKCALWYGDEHTGMCSLKRGEFDLSALGKVADKMDFGHGV